MMHRKWHKLIAVGFGLGLVVLLELSLRVFGVGRPQPADDPFVGFSAIRPLFIRDRNSGRMRTAPSRLKFFPEQSFAEPKAPGTFRIFCFGGSTVQGNPYSTPTAFPTWLQLDLEAAAPERQWEVINCGGISYASYRLANILEECLYYEPDLFILCTGHNEFLEDRTYAAVKQAPAWLTRSQELATRLHTYQVLRRAWLALQPRPAPAAAGSRPLLKEEVDAWLDYEGGLKAYHRDAPWREGVITHFEHNLRRMTSMANRAEVPLLLVLPPSNLRGSPPFKSEHRKGLADNDRSKWETFSRTGADLLASDPTRALENLLAARALDDQYALTAYHLGQAYDALHRPDEGRRAYLTARELDICPLRILAPMEEGLARVAAESGTPLIDAQRLLAERSPDGIPGNEWLVDHVHPSIDGNRAIAAALFEEMTRAGWVRPAPGWETARERAHARQFASLPNDYYAEGERALAGLRAWTDGRASGPAIEYRMMQPPTRRLP